MHNLKAFSQHLQSDIRNLLGPSVSLKITANQEITNSKFGNFNNDHNHPLYTQLLELLENFNGCYRMVC
jgi:hypothetical protein